MKKLLPIMLSAIFFFDVPRIVPINIRRRFIVYPMRNAIFYEYQEKLQFKSDASKNRFIIIKNK